MSGTSPLKFENIWAWSLLSEGVMTNESWSRVETGAPGSWSRVLWTVSGFVFPVSVPLTREFLRERTIELDLDLDLHSEAKIHF